MIDRTADALVDGVFLALSKLVDADLIALSGVWMAGDAEVRKEAWSRVGAVPGDDRRAQSLARGRDRLASWVNDLGITWAGAYERSIVVPSGADQGNLRRNAVPAILDAMAGILFEELITPEERDELLEPLRHVTESEAADD